MTIEIQREDRRGRPERDSGYKPVVSTRGLRRELLLFDCETCGVCVGEEHAAENHIREHYGHMITGNPVSFAPPVQYRRHR